MTEIKVILSEIDTECSLEINGEKLESIVSFKVEKELGKPPLVSLVFHADKVDLSNRQPVFNLNLDANNKYEGPPLYDKA